MPAYLIAEHTITDPKKFEEYSVKVGPIITKHGGRYITKGDSHVVLEEDNAVWQPGRVVIVEFPAAAELAHGLLGEDDAKPVSVLTDEPAAATIA